MDKARGFSVNQQTMVKNFDELGLTSLRMVCDGIVHHGREIKDFPIPISPLIACQSAHQKYRNDLECDRRKTEGWRIEELNIVKKRKIDEESLIKKLKDDSHKLIIEAGERSDVAQKSSLVVKVFQEVQSFKKTAEEREKILVDYASSIEKVE